MKISNLAAAAIYTLFSSKLVNGRLKIGNNELVRKIMKILPIYQVPNSHIVARVPE